MLYMVLQTNRINAWALNTQTYQIPPHHGGKILLMYSGPIDNATDYMENFFFFLDHGLPCSYHSQKSLEYHIDVAVIVSRAIAHQYQHKLSLYNKGCGGLIILHRTNNCVDMNSYRVALDAFRNQKYDYYIGLNCGLIGPLLPLDQPIGAYWINRFLSLISLQTRLAGLSLNCQAGFQTSYKIAHVQSMLFVTDAIGMKIIEDAGVIYDCTYSPWCWSAIVDPVVQNFDHVWYHCKMRIVGVFEIGMSQAILNAGFSITGINPSQNNLTITQYALDQYTPPTIPEFCVDIWSEDMMSLHNHGKTWDPVDVVFWKRSRFFPESIKQHVWLQERLAFIAEISQTTRHSHQ